MKIVELRDVKKIYKTGKIEYEALKGVDLEINKGEFMAIIGPSGSGKTTLLNLIGCLDNTTSGKIFLEGEDITSLKPKDLTELRRKKIGFIFQTFNLMPVLTVYENIEFPLFFNKVSSKIRKERVESLIEELGLDNVSRHRVSDISGGQQQRTAIGRALIKDPIIVLADEPTGNLDSETGMKIIELMKKLNKERGVTFLFVTHDLMVMSYAEIVHRLRDGKIENERCNRM
ncbi:MAG: ABC transporter ATP-binding protein [bacterium]|nr:ABC transporter ATP-binding protein [bacterium]